VADIRLSVLSLAPYAQLVAPAVHHLVRAYQPFGVNLSVDHPPELLPSDPMYSDGWRDLVNQLAQRSTGAAYVVFSGIPPGFDRSINGQLMTRDRGVCALFLRATSFQTPSPDARGDLVAQVLIHEVGHVMNLTHGDAYKSGGCSDAVMPTTDRQSQLPEDAWREAIEDAASRGELPLVAPVPTLIYPFGAQCRACLRAAAKDPAWWPWRTPFRGDFNAGSEDRSRALTLSIHRLGRGRPIYARHGVDFTLEIRNNSFQPVPMPAHVGPEFGTLVVSSVATAGGEEAFFAPDNYRCSSALQSILPGASVFRSFSLVPGADQEFLASEGAHVLRVRLSGSNGKNKLQLGSVEIDIEVQGPGDDREPIAVATRLIAAAKGAADLPSRAAFGHLDRLADQSSAAFHAKYKLALMHGGKERARLLRECLRADVPAAIRHRAGRQLAMDDLKAGRMKAGPSKALQRAFDRPEDAEFFETLQRMRDGWNALSPLTRR
jgi:hypothetical protein